jgi:hypothetical protein
MNAVLWILQVLLALLFVFAGGMKLVLPAEKLMMPGAPVQFPISFLRFIGLAELLGGLGLVLPWLFRIRTGLTPLAAIGLTIIMIGATATTLILMGDVQAAVMPAVVGALLMFVAYGRWRLAPRTPGHATPATRRA